MTRQLQGLLALFFCLWLSPALAQSATTPAQTAIVCAYNSSPPTVTTGNWVLVQCDSSGKLITSGGGGGGGGAVTVADGADVTQGAQADSAYAGSGSASVVSILKGLYSAITGASTGLAGTTPATNGPYASGSTSNLDTDLNGNLYTRPVTGAYGGATPYSLIAAATNNSTLISTGAHTVYGAQLSGIGAAPAYLKLYDKATAPTCGTDTPVAVYQIPANSTAALGGGSNIALPLGKAFTLGLGICVVTGIANTDNTAVAASTFIINIDYK